MKTALLALALALTTPALVWPNLAGAQELSALARLDGKNSEIVDVRGGVSIELALSQPVPWRVRVLDDPARLIVDMREVDWSQLDNMFLSSEAVGNLRAGLVRQGWSRLVVELTGPYVPQGSQMITSEAGAKVRLKLVPTTDAQFSSAAAEPEPEAWAMPKAAALPPKASRLPGPWLVVLDPGHGGLDPGAERGGLREADIMLTFARELKELLLRDGDFDVVLTRDDDEFIPLETRIKIARAAGADVFLSLHADALAEGQASGATLYTLAEDASDAAALALAERHDRAELLAGVDLSEQDDMVATVLMDMARTETQPRVDRLSETLVTAMTEAGLALHGKGHQTGSFSVLKSPDIPSALLELGFISSPKDLARLRDPLWRAEMAGALRTGLRQWAREDAAFAAMRKP